jgi:quercetin dioxygenase-like cupin family protein
VQRAIEHAIASSETNEGHSLDQPLSPVRIDAHPATAVDQSPAPPARPHTPPMSIHGVRRWTAVLATAAILLLALGASIQSLDLNPLGRGDRVPAVPAPTVQPGFSEQILLDVVLTPEESGFDGPFGTGLAYASAPPGSRGIWPTSHGQTPEARVFYLVNGTLRVKGDLPLRVVRANGDAPVEQVPADNWVTLNTGDALLRAPDVSFEYESPGTESSYVLSWTLGGAPTSGGESGYQPPEWQHINAAWGYDGTRPDSQARFTLRRVTLEKEATLPSPSGAYFQQYLDVDRLSGSTLGVGSDYSISNRGTTTADLFVISAEPAPGQSRSQELEAVTEQTLLDVDLAGAQLKTMGRFNSIMGYYAVPAGSSESWSGPTDNAPEPLVWYVLSGAYTVRAEQELQVARAGNNGTTEIIAQGQEVTLGPGDALVRPARAAMELANSGQDPVHLVVWTLGDINVQGPSLPPSWDSLPCYPGQTSGTTPTGSVRFTLRLVTIPPQSALDAPPGTFVQQYLDLTTEAPNLGQKSDYSLINQGTEPATLYVVVLEPAHQDDGAAPSS